MIDLVTPVVTEWWRFREWWMDRRAKRHCRKMLRSMEKRTVYRRRLEHVTERGF